MVKKMLIALVSLSLFSCSGELEEKSMPSSLRNEKIHQIECKDPAIVKDIKNYITHLKFGGVKALSKAFESYSLTPYIYKGDTVMYIANYTGTDNLGNDTNEYDEYGNIIGYSFTYERENATSSWAIMMNWG